MKRTLLVLTALFAFTAIVHAQKCMIKMKSGKIKNADSISADSSGNLTVKNKKFTTKIKRKEYVYAWVPMSTGLKAISKKIASNDNKAALELVAKYHSKYKNLGWDFYCIYMKALAESKLKKDTDAIKTLQAIVGREVKNPKNEKYLLSSYKLLATLYINAAKFNDANAILKKIEYAQDPQIAAFALNALGDILNRKNKKQDAVNKYLQTVLLFQTANPERAEALCRVANLLKELKDNRCVKYSNMLKKEYPKSEFIKQLK